MNSAKRKFEFNLSALKQSIVEKFCYAENVQAGMLHYVESEDFNQYLVEVYANDSTTKSEKELDVNKHLTEVLSKVFNESANMDTQLKHLQSEDEVKRLVNKIKNQ